MGGIRSIVLLLLLVTCTSSHEYFNNIYDSLVNAQETLKDVSYSVGKGLKSLGKAIQFFEKFIDSTIEEDCIYECPKSNEYLISNPNHIPDFNGCGSLGMQLSEEDLPNTEMIQCCNRHDKCYDTCASDKEECDKFFKRCLYRTCLDDKERNPIKYKICQGGAKLLYTTTIALGCTSYKDAQQQACICKSLTQTKTNDIKREL